MHITAGIWVNDEESGLKHDVMEWLEQLAPAGDYRHHQTGEDNADAHLKRTLVHHQVILPITAGRARSRSVGAGLLRRVRRPAEEARRGEDPGRVGRAVSLVSPVAFGVASPRAPLQLSHRHRRRRDLHRPRARPRRRARRSTSIPTTPRDQSEGVLGGLAAARGARGVDARASSSRAPTLIVHGTTTADNTMIEMSGAVTGLVTSEGHRDEIEIRRGYKENIWDPAFPPPPPICPRRRRYGVPERLDYEGNVVDPARRGGGAARAAAHEAPGRRVAGRRAALLLRQPGARAARARDRGGGAAGRHGLAVARGDAAGARVRAHQHDAGERLRRAEDRALPEPPRRAAARGGLPRRAAHHAVERRRDAGRLRGAEGGRRDGLRAGGRCDGRDGGRRRRGRRATSSRSTWAARATTSAWCATARPR